MNNLTRSCLYILCFVLLCGLGVRTAQAAPPNDSFAAAAVLTGETGTTTGNNILASAEPGEPAHDTVTDAKRSVWYQWTAPSTGEYYFNTFGSDFDTILAVYTGNAVGTLTSVTENDDYNGPIFIQSRVFFPAETGTTYHIAVDGWEGDQGYLALNWGPASLLPGNDNLASASGISGSAGATTGTNINATPEGGESVHHVN
ncbi:MAG TPA: hypothetical protein ENO11_00095, partial [Desulfobacteraceae bacterium]|nr:hypothetical protein [Desulfobacteraceae bacterium]